MFEKSKSKKRAKSARKAAKKPKPADDVEEAGDFLVATLTQHTELLEIIALSVARLMMIADHENRLAGEARTVPDPHGLRRDVEKLLTRNAMNKTLLPDDDSISEVENDDEK